MPPGQGFRPFAPNPYPQSSHLSGVFTVASSNFCHTVQMPMCLALRLKQVLVPVILNGCIPFHYPLSNSVTAPLLDWADTGGVSVSYYCSNMPTTKY